VNCVASYNFSAAGNNTGNVPLDPKMLAFFKSYPAPNRYDCGDALNTGCYV
jgi:hypothetical protein